MSRRTVLSLLALVGLAALTLALQKPDTLSPRVFAIVGGRVVVEPGKVLEKATVVIRDGTIFAVGDVKPPADALVLDAKGMTVYPGFVDALSYWGIDGTLRRPEGGPPAVPDMASDALFATSPEQRKGLTPEFQTRTALKADDEQAEAWRKLGFTARLAAPDGGIVGGQSAVLSLAGGSPRDAILHGQTALHITFGRASGEDYPRALMGVFAHVRQLFLDAQHYRQLWTSFENLKQRGKRPPLDPALAALAPYLDGKLPVVFEADTRDEISRALDFAAEFKLKPVIHGGRDAWKVADRLAKEGVPVLLRLVERPGRGEGRPPWPKRVEKDQQRLKEEDHRCAAILVEKKVPLAITTQGVAADKFRAALRQVIDAGLSKEAAQRALSTEPARILGVANQLGTLERGKAAHLVVLDGEPHEADTQAKYVFSDGVRFEYETKPRIVKPSSSGPKKDSKGSGDVDFKELMFPNTELDEDRTPTLKTKGNVLLRGGTLITVSNGIKPETDLLVLDGKIARMGKELKAPEDRGPVTVLDVTGKFIMPGIIDTHSHFAISGGVNEFSLSVVPEVRVRDVINSEDVSIYRGLAGGVTTARLLHGSANVIGGQDAVIKLKYGQPAESLLVPNAPRGVKFALGENVKRSNGRFPNSRLGVEAVLVRAFTEARTYQQEWDQYHRSLKKPMSNFVPLPPRRDLRLEALAEILKGDIRVHCHCYRSDEILMLLRVADRFGIKIRSLQHVLEGYKIAPEIADHGASCSLFADWWAYKIEAFDAIPFAAALLHKAGASVCLKSDSNELMRHLYQEAAKCVKYGGMSEDDALKTITLNPAKQLGLDSRLGSLDLEKEADLVVFNGHPLNSYARVETVLIDGEVYFQAPNKEKAPLQASARPAPPTDFKAIARNPAGKYALLHLTLHPATGPAIEHAGVVVANGRIAQILRETHVKAIEFSKDTTVINAAGLHLYPGMIDASTILGLAELGSAKETNDYADLGDFQPDLRASTAINPDSELIPVTRANGVTTVVTRPTGSIIAGQGALINLAGWVPREMTVVDPIALHIDFPSPFQGSGFLTDPNGPNPARAIAKQQRAAKIRKLKELFQQALNHHAASKASLPVSLPPNPRLEALIPYARGDKPIIVQAHREEEIREALKLMDELKIKMILSGAIDAWRVKDELKKRDVPVLLGPIMALPTEAHDPYDAPYTCAGKLHAAGVRFCIRSSGGSNTRNLPYEAAMAVSYGLPAEEGLKAVTLYPARILGVEKELGSIESGKRANLVLTNGDLLQASTQVLSLFIDGKPLAPTSKQTRLYERYLERLEEVKSGKAPLGTK